MKAIAGTRPRRESVIRVLRIDLNYFFLSRKPKRGCTNMESALRLPRGYTMRTSSYTFFFEGHKLFLYLEAELFGAKRESGLPFLFEARDI